MDEVAIGDWVVKVNGSLRPIGFHDTFTHLDNEWKWERIVSCVNPSKLCHV